MRNEVTDTLNHLSGNWNESVISRPVFREGRRKTTISGPKNMVLVFPDKINISHINPQKTLWDETYYIRIQPVSTISNADRNNMVNECLRIIGHTGMTNYQNMRMVDYKNMDVLKEFRSEIRFVAYRYSQS